MQKTVDYTSLRIKRMKRRALIRKIYPFVLLLIAFLVICLILRCRNVVKPVSYIPRVEACSLSGSLGSTYADYASVIGGKEWCGTGTVLI